MDPLSAAIAAGGSILGQHMANRANIAQARDQMRYQQMMSNTAYQRAMSDMRKAGLNPILAAKVGGASTPSGAMANIGNIIQPGVEAYQKVSSAKQMQTVNAIEKRTLDMLERENVSMAEIQYTAKNIFESKALKAFEAGISGDLSGLQEPYRSAARFLMVELKRAGALPDTAGMKGQGRVGLEISGKTLGKLVSQYSEIILETGLEGFTDFGLKLLGVR
jgi:hypothetical protein